MQPPDPSGTLIYPLNDTTSTTSPLSQWERLSPLEVIVGKCQNRFSARHSRLSPYPHPPQLFFRPLWTAD